MRTSLFIFIFGLLVFACQRKLSNAANNNESVITSGKEIPTCIQGKIDSIKKLPIWNPPATIEEYEYNGKKVYVISADCCDFFTTAVNDNCNYICAPSGGFTGKGDGLCKDFNANAKFIKIVWKDERTKKSLK